MGFLNKIKGKISYIESSDNISYVKISTSIGDFSALIIESPYNVDYLKEDKEVNVLFNASSVSLSKDKIQNISISNILPAKVKKIENSDVLSLITMECFNTDIKSMITKFSVEKLDLKVDDDVFFLVKATDVMLEV